MSGRREEHDIRGQHPKVRPVAERHELHFNTNHMRREATVSASCSPYTTSKSTTYCTLSLFGSNQYHNLSLLQHITSKCAMQGNADNAANLCIENTTNEGGIWASACSCSTRTCFICTHPAAHKNNVQGRNQDYFKFRRSHDMAFWLGVRS